MTDIGNNHCFSEDDTYEEEEEEEEQDSAPRNIAQFSEDRLPTSPSENFWSQTISPILERRMNKYIYKDGKRCLIENTNDGALHYVHCLSRRLDPGRINDLEFAWVSAKFKSLWEDYKWILVPGDHILERYLIARQNNESFPDIGEGPYKYRLFTDPDMKSVAIHRQINFPDKETEGLKSDHFLFSAFPFHNLGILTSHIHPKYAICHIVARPLMLTNILMFQYGQADPTALHIIRQCMRVVAIWSPHLKDVASNDSGFLISQIHPDDIYSETSDRTANCRLRPHWSDNRLTEEQVDGYVYVKEDGVVRFKHKEDVLHLLAAKKLRIFDEKMFVHQTTKIRWKTIQSWRSSVSGKPEEQEQIDDSDTNSEHSKE
ncbi:hypothetical protein Clacol_006037 [Clathrus columnatus]|uniref:Uncharacterized protein n=1 Tax=Clathrus columnatus TaxID=1419009 RepID=A0AAV5AGI8_9AGAM|nr:hypothetical protein Clacol_006037 [Clathrus columnatus]